ncbi:zinc finger protein [Amycolatopsis sp. NPDC051373]|uniref:zinc finger protein n=1 Tax=Amycolatopsis sp. NPDC051373 TaxID=3155801 RepID=UPI00344BBDC5
MYVWQQAAGQRHARAAVHHGSLDAGATFAALCGADKTVGENDIHSPGKPWLDPTCPSCDTAFRRALGVPAPRPDAAPRAAGLSKARS